MPILFSTFFEPFILHIHTQINETLFHSSFLSLEVSPYSFSELLYAHGSCFDTFSFTAIDHFHDGIRALLGRALLCFISDLLLILSHRFFFLSLFRFSFVFSLISRFLVLFFLFYYFFGFFWTNFPFGMKKEEEESTPSYLYLHPSENPTTPLVSPVLDSSIYHSWSLSMLTALSAKDKLEFVDGTATQPTKTDSTFSTWNRCNNMVVSWLVHSVSVPIRQSIVWMDKAVEIWNDLKTRYSQGDLSHISDLQMEASLLSQGELSITDYFTKLRVIWDELENFRPESVCICKNCTCNISSIFSQRKRED